MYSEENRVKQTGSKVDVKLRDNINHLWWGKVVMNSESVLQDFEMFTLNIILNISLMWSTVLYWVQYNFVCITITLYLVKGWKRTLRLSLNLFMCIFGICSFEALRNAALLILARTWINVVPSGSKL